MPHSKSRLRHRLARIMCSIWLSGLLATVAAAQPGNMVAPIDGSEEPLAELTTSQAEVLLRNVPDIDPLHYPRPHWRLQLGVPEKDLALVTLTPAVLRELQQSMEGMLADEILPDPESWQAYVLPSDAYDDDAAEQYRQRRLSGEYDRSYGAFEDDPAPVDAAEQYGRRVVTGEIEPHGARAAVSAVLELPDGDEVTLQGLAWRTNIAAGLVMRADGAEASDQLETRVPASFLRWPPGTLGAGRVRTEPLADGTLWIHGPPQAGMRLDEGTWRWWPHNVACWSDGRWIVLWLSMLPHPWASSAWAPYPCFTWAAEVDPEAPPTCMFSFLTGQRGPAFASEAHAVSRPEVPEPITEWQDQMLLEILVNTPLPNTTPPRRRDLAEAAESFIGDWSADTIHFVPADVWRTGEVSPVPAAIRWLMELPDDAATWTTEVELAPDLPACPAGLMTLDTPDGTYRMVQWILAPGRAYVTALDRRPSGVVIEDLTPGPGRRAAVGGMVHSLLGAQGAYLRFSTVEIDEDGFPGGFSVAPVSDAPFGLLGESTVGEQPWGNCRIYVHPSILHIVFDLPEEDDG
ncbi:MAG: hypothetical protein GF320_09860 [Armatimonadia bacterium]|nr:hypothetical protein [Armatimonadia bacterium]